MQVFPLLILAVSATKQTAKGETPRKPVRNDSCLKFNIHHNLNKKLINLGVTKITYFKPRSRTSIQECVFQFQIPMTNFLHRNDWPR